MKNEFAFGFPGKEENGEVSAENHPI
jgi:hypothetical protein